MKAACECSALIFSSFKAVGLIGLIRYSVNARNFKVRNIHVSFNS